MSELQNIGPNIWVVSKELPKVKGFSSRMTIIRNTSQELFLISPIKISDSLLDEIKILGKVVAILSPNGFHHLFLKEAQEKFSEAKIYGPEILLKKRKDLTALEIIKPDNKYPWDSTFSFLSIPARPVMGEELVFFHSESKTVVTTDLVFNIQTCDSFFGFLFLKFNGTYKKMGMSNFGRLFFKDKKILKQKVQAMLSWQPEKLVMGHGTVILKNATAELTHSFEWLLKRAVV